MNTNKIFIAGICKQIRSLAASLIEKGYRVTAADPDYVDCQKLAETDKLSVIYGDASKKFILEEAGIDEHTIVIALFDDDEKNLIICEMAKQYFKAKKTVCMLNDSSKTSFFYKMGVDRVVCAMNMINSIMEEQVLMDEIVHTVVLDGRLKIVEIMADEKSSVIDKHLWELNLPKEVIIGCIIRNQRGLIPRGDTLINKGDRLIVITSDTAKVEALC